jgi:signal transduction histidine kinase/DNA-binding NarL/FixJ family response regulator
MASTALAVGDLLERRYLSLIRLASSIAGACDWQQLGAAVSNGLELPLEEPERSPRVRIWGILSEGFEELSRYPAEDPWPQVHARELQRAAVIDDPTEYDDGCLLVGLHAGGVSLGVLEVDAPTADAELIANVAPIVACRMSVLAGQGVGDVLIAPFSVEGTSDAAPLMAQFAAEAKRLLDHDRLSAYLLTHHGRAFERFAVATSPIIPGEGVIIPFEDVGLRHIVLTNRALVSRDLATDPRIVGREDRVIARAGFHGLLSVPLRREGRAFGVLNFVSRTPGFYRDDDIPIAQQLSDQISAFVENLYVQRRMRLLIRHEAAERERTRVARDVYHAIAQTVPEIDAVAAKLGERLASLDPEGAEQAERVRALAEMELAEVRRAVAGLVPQALDAHSLEDGIQGVLAGLGDGSPKTTFKAIGDTSRLSGAATRAAFRIFQEALTNARLHAEADVIDVMLRSGRDLELIVADDGIGFDVERLGESPGIGLQFMRERAQALGGVLTVESAPGKGTTVRLQLLGAHDATEQSHTTEEAAGPGIATLRVFIAEHNHLVRSGLIRLIERSGDMRLVGEACSAEELRGQLKRMRPDIVLLDGYLANGRLSSLVQEVREQAPGTVILALAENDVAREAEVLEAGARGIVDKGLEAPELVELVRAFAEGRAAPFSPAAPGEAEPPGVLTPRECSILALVAAGDTNNEIGKKLFLATKTVERHVATIVRKLGARNRAHAAAIAVSKRLVDPPNG